MLPSKRKCELFPIRSNYDAAVPHTRLCDRLPAESQGTQSTANYTTTFERLGSESLSHVLQTDISPQNAQTLIC
jgi:hypothetical protein